MYVPLHVHTHFSMLDGVATPEEYVRRAKELGMPGLAITDHGSLSGHRKMYFAAKDAEIKPVLGVEAYICPDRFDRRDKSERTQPLDLIYNHIILLAKNETGLRNLGMMNEIAWTEGFFRKPRIDFDVLERHREGIIVSSACLSGLVAKAIEVGDLITAKAHVAWFKERFGQDFYIEVMPHNPPHINKELLAIADAFGVKAVVTPDCHHATADQQVIQEMMLLINTHAKLQKDVTYESSVKFTDMMERLDYLYGDRMLTFKDFKIHMLSPAEMQAEMQEQGIDRVDIYENTVAVLEKVEDYNITKTDFVELPVDFDDPQRELERLVYEGLEAKGLAGDERYTERLSYELEVIKAKSFGAYFLIVHDMVNWAREQGIRVGPGRGSAAGSLVCYVLGITDVDPIEYDLLFERFISPDRTDLPDIDTDFMDVRRDEVKQYLADKYGNVASIATFVEFSDKNIVRDVSRVLNIPLSDVNKVLKQCHAWEDFVGGNTTAWFRNKYPEVVQYGEQLRGRIRATGAHAAGVVLSKQPLRNFAPIETRSSKKEDRLLVVGIDGDEAAEAGLTKLDSLGLATLTVIDDCLKIIKERHGVDIDLNKINYEEPAVYKMLADGYTKGVFQCEAAPYTNLLIKMQVKNLAELAASNALIRPGAMNTIGKVYLDRKAGRDTVTYPNEIMRQITKGTYGCIVYQEQVMQACMRLGGMTGAEAEKVRKIIGKKKDASEFDQFRDKFLAGATQHIGRGLAEHLWHDFEAHSGYSFNKSHAYAYSKLSYQCAWLKHFFPVEFMYALLKNEGDPDMRTQYLIEAKRMGIPVKLPHINVSELDFSIKGDAIVMGLTAIKFISDNIGSKYIAARPFESYEQVEAFTFTKGNGVNSRALAAMRAVGALTFPDNPRDEEAIKANLYEYLNLPELDLDLPPWFDIYFTNIEDYVEGETVIIRGIAKKIKRGTGWSRVEFMDKTGMVGVFDDEETKIERGKMYVVLVSNKRIVEAVPAESVNDESNALMRFMHYKEVPYSDGEFYVLAFKPRTTKAGKRMANAVLANADREIKEVVVFPAKFTKAYMYCEPGSVQKLLFKKLDDGTVSLEEVCRN